MRCGPAASWSPDWSRLHPPPNPRRWSPLGLFLNIWSGSWPHSMNCRKTPPQPALSETAEESPGPCSRPWHGLQSSCGGPAPSPPICQAHQVVGGVLVGRRLPIKKTVGTSWYIQPFNFPNGNTVCPGVLLASRIRRIGKPRVGFSSLGTCISTASCVSSPRDIFVMPFGAFSDFGLLGLALLHQHLAQLQHRPSRVHWHSAGSQFRWALHALWRGWHRCRERLSGMLGQALTSPQKAAATNSQTVDLMLGNKNLMKRFVSPTSKYCYVLWWCADHVVVLEDVLSNDSGLCSNVPDLRGACVAPHVHEWTRAELSFHQKISWLVCRFPPTKEASTAKRVLIFQKKELPRNLLWIKEMSEPLISFAHVCTVFKWHVTWTRQILARAKIRNYQSRMSRGAKLQWQIFQAQGIQCHFLCCHIV